MTTYAGLDPDLHCCVLAVLDGEGEVSLRVARIGAQVTGTPAAAAMARALGQLAAGMHELELQALQRGVLAVEGQTYTTRGRFGRARPRDVARCSFVAGAAVAALSAPGTLVLVPEPREWKGDVPKDVHQARVARELGWEVEVQGDYCVPVKPEVRALLPRVSDWKHGFDSIGLALWARKQHELSGS